MKEIGKIIHILDVKLKRKIDRLALEYGITSVQFVVMECIYSASREHDFFQRDLEAALDVRRSTISNVLGLLEKKHYITRETVSSDARLKKLRLTSEGAKVYRDFKKLLSKSEADDLQIFSEEEAETLIALLIRLSDALS